MSNKEINWIEREVSLDDLKPYERNPRKITEQDFENLKRSLSEDGYHQRITATRDLRIVGGHQRIKALKQLGKKTIKILIPDVDISDEQFKRILIRDNLPFGMHDFDIIASDFDLEQLRDWGMPESWLPDFSPASEEDQGKLDEKEEKEQQCVNCPKCGHSFLLGDENG